MGGKGKYTCKPVKEESSVPILFLKKEIHQCTRRNIRHKVTVHALCVTN